MKRIYFYHRVNCELGNVSNILIHTYTGTLMLASAHNKYGKSVRPSNISDVISTACCYVREKGIELILYKPVLSKSYM